MRLVVIDPITAYLGGTDSHRNADMRALLAPLAELAARHVVAVVAVSHLNKNAKNPAMYRTTGSLAFVAAARAAWAVAKDQDNPDRRNADARNRQSRCAFQKLRCRDLATQFDSSPQIRAISRSYRISWAPSYGSPASSCG